MAALAAEFGAAMDPITDDATDVIRGAIKGAIT